MSSTSNFDLIKIAFIGKLPLKAVLSKNELNQIKEPRNGGYIINLQNTHDRNGNRLEGTHWVSLYVEGKYICYFDSYGIVPPLEIMKFGKKISRKMLVNTVHIQNIYSGYCGLYCLEFIEYMYEKRRVPFEKRFADFINLWNPEPTQNLKLLKRYMKN